MYSYLLLLWPELIEEIAERGGPLLLRTARRNGLDPRELSERLARLLGVSSTAESFACEASWLFTPE